MGGPKGQNGNLPDFLKNYNQKNGNKPGKEGKGD
jgi:hypothetical protein